MLDSGVLKYLYRESVKKFICSQSIDFDFSGIDDSGLTRLFNTAKYESKRNFLVQELLFGLQRNVYVSKINQFGHNLRKQEICLSQINTLTDYLGDMVAEEDTWTSGDIGRNIASGEKKLLYYNLNKSKDNNVHSIDMILCKGIEQEDEELTIYYSITIDIINNILIVRMRNMGTEYKWYKVDDYYQEIRDYLVNNMYIILERNDSNYYRKTIYNILDYTTNTVLSSFYKQIDKNIGNNIEQQVTNWNGILAPNDITLQDKDSIIKGIKNLYCKIISQNTLENLTGIDIKQNYGVDGYPARVVFEDDSIGNTRVKSENVDNTLLNTTTFYDIKESMERCKNIKVANILWTDNNDNRVNTTFNNEKQGKFKVTIISNYFNKEMNDYVLQKIIQYSPR
ncbi:Uncharacterised protein [[Clostridium] sordellii]|uniref:hypothetical protein n=1 Tax=Paraclostridium sordellii TaxID=1505 RepID=UPI0005EA1B49|nr:hypothetical protein [Paeniclostridium sordellii]CEQ08961.1 Uncharacterised protein [[Clostridium] sordellii] [Paeniclostridium sordellii]